MLLKGKVSVGQEDRVVKFLAPAHDGARIALHICNSRLCHDEGGKEGVLIHDHSATTAETLDQLHTRLLALLLMQQLMCLPTGN